MKLTIYVSSAADLHQIADAVFECGAASRSEVFRSYSDAYGYPETICGVFALHTVHDFKGDAALSDLLAHMEAKYDRLIALTLEKQAKARRAAQ